MAARLTPNFSLEELTISQEAARRGIDNTPPAEILPALIRTAEGLELIRAALGKPVTVTSGYRSKAVNAAVGGKESSQHVRGEAADIICPGFGSPAAVARFLESRMADLGLDQVILEFGRWVHVSFAQVPRHMALTIDAAGTRPGIVA